MEEFTGMVLRRLFMGASLGMSIILGLPTFIMLTTIAIPVMTSASRGVMSMKSSLLSSG